MTNEKLILFLQSTGFVTTAQAADITKNFTHKALSKNNFLLQAGRVSDDYFFLDSGCLRAFAYDVASNDVTTGFYTSRQVVFEVASFFQRTPSQEYLQALTDCAGYGISHAQLNALFHARPEFREFGRSVLVRGFADLKSFAFEQPNVAILYFPYAWLPAVVVPIVLLAHVAALRQLLVKGRSTEPLGVVRQG